MRRRPHFPSAPAGPDIRFIRETHHVGTDTQEWTVDGHAFPALRSRNIEFTGVSDASVGFEFQTRGWRYGQIMACVAGEGRVRVGQAWQVCGPGTAYLTPPEAPHAYHAISGSRWTVAWITYDPPVERTPLASLSLATLVTIDPRAIHAAIEGLYHESISSADPALMEAWAEVLHLAAWRVVGRSDASAQLWKVWDAVAADLGHNWSNESLAEIVNVSTEHLRRLCQRELARSPMAHVTHLRMRRAASMLLSTRLKIDAIAKAIGYEDRFGFSAAFRRSMGVSPAQYRRKSAAVRADR